MSAPFQTVEVRLTLSDDMRDGIMPMALAAALVALPGVVAARVTPRFGIGATRPSEVVIRQGGTEAAPYKKHFVEARARRTACGRHANKVPGGTSLLWTDVTCPACLEQRP